MVTKWGMGIDPEAKDRGTSGRGSLGFLVTKPNGSFPSEVQAAATRAIRAILDEAYADACRVLLEHMDTLRRLSAYLVEHERVDGETFEELFDGRRDVPNGLDEWRPADARPRAWADISAYHDRRLRPVPSPEAVPQVPTAAITPVGSGIPGDAGMAHGPAPGRPRLRSLTGRKASSSARTPSPQSVPKTRLARPQIGRRLRGLAAAYLHAAESRLLSSEAEVDRS
jgi:hypothetical protein